VSDGPAQEIPGLQRERTSLAWERTGVGFIVAGALLMRVGGTPYHHPRHAPAALAILFGATLIYGAARRYHRHLEGRSTAFAAPQWWIRASGVIAVAFSAAALLIVVIGG
jgi:uncharacterized membrane protein YidH (DUF202 family)